MPRISFDDPLPLGVEGEAERMRMMVSPHHTCREVMDLLNAHLPEGIQVTRCRLKPAGKKRTLSGTHRYRVHLQQVRLDGDPVNRFWQSDEWLYVRENRKGRKLEFDLRQIVQRLEFEDDDTLYIEIKPATVHSVRAADVLFSVFELSADRLPDLKMVKLAGMHIMEG